MPILIVEDDLITLDGLQHMVVAMGHQALTATTVAAGYELAQSSAPSLILLDMRLPDGTGTELLASLRRSIATHTTPVIMLTSINDVETKLETFELGVEDYVVKPFDMRELMARINVALRRSATLPIAGISGAKYDAVDKVLSTNKTSVTLTPNEDRLFRVLFTRPNEAVPKLELYQYIWGERRVGARNLDTLVNYLRKKIEPSGLEIKAVYGVGYMLASDQSASGRS